MILIAKKQRLA